VDIIRIGIVEDDLHWQKLLSNYLNTLEDFQVIWVASQRDIAVSLANDTKDITDIILMDLNLSSSERDGINAIWDICQQSNVKIIVLSSYSDGVSIRDAFTAGAINYILKENFKDIPIAIRSSFYGKSPLEEVLGEYKQFKEESLLKKLTPSEREIFELIKSGKSQNEITRLLYKTESTVKSQVNSILKKLKVKSSKHAIEKVKRRGLL
jgi:DNA-binding NarL/FixJ family response regulator